VPRLIAWGRYLPVASALAIALFSGLRGAAMGRRALFVLPLVWFAGGLLGVTNKNGKAIGGVE
jgi:hypothetical protein